MIRAEGLAKGFATELKGDCVRGAVVNGGFIIRLVTGHSLGWRLLVDQRAVLVRRAGSIRSAGLDGGIALGKVGRDEAGIDGCSNPADPKASGTSNSEE